jgi:hypothetical protein
MMTEDAPRLVVPLVSINACSTASAGARRRAASRPARTSAGRIACSTRITLPAVPTASENKPGRTRPGTNVRRREPTAAPSTRADEISAAAFTHVRCWRISPGFGRPARMFVMVNGRPVTIDSASADRSICLPPSPSEPSIRIIELASR